MDFLKGILGEQYEAFEAAIKAHNEANKDKPVKLADLSTGSYVHRDKYADAETKLKSYEKQVEELSAAVEEFKGKGGDDDFKKQLEEVEAAYQKKLDDLKDTLEKERFSSKVEEVLMASNAKNTKALRALIDMDSVKLEDGSLVGIAEQIEAIKKDNDYLFDDGAKSTGMKMGGAPPAKDTFIDSARAAAGLKKD